MDLVEKTLMSAIEKVNVWGFPLSFSSESNKRQTKVFLAKVSSFLAGRLNASWKREWRRLQNPMLYNLEMSIHIYMLMRI